MTEGPGGIQRVLEERPGLWQIPLLVALSLGYEAIFVYHGINIIDESWPLYAAKRLHEGGTLYADTFFVFPPLHLLAAWIAWAVEPPGYIAARWIYALFHTAACVAVYLLGRRLMPTPYALLGALLLAVATPSSHISHLLFGYRYLVFSLAALLCFARHLGEGGWRWIFASGLCAGVGLVFRLTPSAAVCAGIAVGLLASTRDWRRWFRDGFVFSAGFLAVVVPVALVFVQSVGLETLWREVVVRPVVMTDLQQLPIPIPGIPTAFDRDLITLCFNAFQFPLYALLYGGYVATLGVRWLRALREGRDFEAPLLAATVAFGAIFFLRALGRADAPHLDSTLPPACLLTAYWVRERGVAVRPGRALRRCAALLAVWVFLSGSDRVFDRDVIGRDPLQALSGRVNVTLDAWGRVEQPVDIIRQLTEPGDVILDLTSSPGLFLLTETTGPGYADVTMPGAFLSDAEQDAFIARLRASPPVLVILPTRPFDRREERDVRKLASRVWDWVEQRYRPHASLNEYVIYVPKGRRGRIPELRNRTLGEP